MGAETEPVAIAPPHGMSRRTRLSLLALCALLGGSGILHFLVPAPYHRIVPAPLRPQAAAIVAASGICELLCAALLALPRTRRFGAYATAAVLVAVFPANIQMALDSLHPGLSLSPGLAIVWLRLPLQYPLIRWALRFRRPD
ncbi:MAG: DoxX family protein [Thermomicrobiales bacterium]